MAVGRTYLYPPLSSGGASLVRPWLRFHIPLIEPDRRIYRIRLSDKTSRLHPRRAAPKLGQAYEAEVLVKGAGVDTPPLRRQTLWFVPRPPPSHALPEFGAEVNPAHANEQHSESGKNRAKAIPFSPK